MKERKRIVKDLVNKEYIDEILANQREYLPNLKYKPYLFKEYFDLINIDRYNQDEAAEKVLKKKYGDDFEKKKKASIESFIKQARKFSKKSSKSPIKQAKQEKELNFLLI